MWPLQKLRQDPDACITALQKRGEEQAEAQVSHIRALDEQRRSLQTEYDSTQARSKQIAKELGEQMRRKPNDPQALELRKEAIKCKTQSSAVAHKLKEIEQKQEELLLSLPNAPHESVPEGRDASANELVRSTELSSFDDKQFLPHWSLEIERDLDLESGRHVTGSGFLFFKGRIARLVRGLVNFFLDRATERGYREVIAPLLVNTSSVMGTGQWPDKEGQMYTLQEAPYYLIPTAEVPITNLHRGHLLSARSLPLKYVGYTPCFRREAGSWGADVRGLNRLHQFDKVEIVAIQEPERSYYALEEMIAQVEELLQALELPYRLLKLCSGDLGFASAMTYDFEVYAVGQKKWLEVSSVSNFECFQSRRMKLRYRTTSGKVEYPHTLNGSALAVPRVLAALLENGQNNGRIRLPSVLHSYTGFDYIDISGS